MRRYRLGCRSNALLLSLTENAGLPCYRAGEIMREHRICSARFDHNPMLACVKTAIGWIFGPLLALVIVPAVFFFERSLRFEKRRDPAWRSR